MTSTDETLAVLTLLEAQAALSAFQFYADADIPPAGYKPANGVGVCFKVRGGNDGDPNVLMHPSFQFKIYAQTEVLCRQAARTLHDNFEGKVSADVLNVYREVLPATLQEPDADWIYVLVFYKVMIRHLS